MVLAIVFALFVGGSAGPQPAVGRASARADAVDETAPVEVPAPSDKALEYQRSGTALWAFDIVWSLGVLLVILVTGFSATLRDWSYRIGRRWFFTLVVYFLAFSAITAIVDLPRAYYEEFVRQHAYGLSNQTLAKWVSDSVKSFLVSCLIGSLVLWVPYLLLRKSPRRWWLYTGLALVPFLVVGSLIAPIWIAPLFNKFEPMQDKALEARILALADRAGIEGGRVFEVNKSVDTSTPNAYVAGLLTTKRIVLWDTIINRMTQPELMFVMGHEMAHYALGHVWDLLAFQSLLLVASFYAAYRTAGAVLARWGGRFGFTSLADVASLPLILLLVNVFSLAITPVTLTFTRHLEHEADRFGLEITHANHSAGTAFVKLQQDALAVPRPSLLYKLWRENHPPLGERIDFTNAYHPWREGKPLVYGDRFKDVRNP